MIGKLFNLRNKPRNSSRLNIAILIIFLITGFSGCTKQKELTNVILISVDTLRADYLNAYRYSKYKTSPNMDALANAGILHSNHIASSPWTTPSHMSLLTSMNPSSHGLIQSFDEVMKGVQGGKKFRSLAEEKVTLAEVLQANGYSTGAFTGGITLDPKIGFGQGFSVYSSDMYKMNEKNMADMLNWVDQNRKKPFFLFWHTFEAHAPYLKGNFLGSDSVGLRKTLQKLKNDLGNVRSLARHGSVNKEYKKVLHRYNAFKKEICMTLYAGGVYSVDFWIGKLLNFLKEKKVYDRTLILLTSDHGEEFAERNPENFYDSHGHSAFEEMIRIPLIIKLPESEHAGLRISTLTRSIDVMPTVMDILDISIVKNRMQGESLAPIWEGRQVPDRLAFSEGAARETEIKSIRTDRYKYIIYISPDVVAKHGRTFVPPEIEIDILFDLQKDPLERINLLLHPEYPNVNKIKNALESRLRSISASEPEAVGEVEFDEETIKKLKALDYIQ